VSITGQVPDLTGLGLYLISHLDLSPPPPPYNAFSLTGSPCVRVTVSRAVAKIQRPLDVVFRRPPGCGGVFLKLFINVLYTLNTLFIHIKNIV